MFEQYDVHNCTKIDDMKNISRLCSCDLSLDEKARPRTCFAGSYNSNRGFISRLQLRCKKQNLFRHQENKQLGSNIDVCVGSTSSRGWTYHSDNIPDEKYIPQDSSRSYPRWFERTVRYLFSKQLRKCFDLA